MSKKHAFSCEAADKLIRALCKYPLKTWLHIYVHEKYGGIVRSIYSRKPRPAGSNIALVQLVPILVPPLPALSERNECIKERKNNEQVRSLALTLALTPNHLTKKLFRMTSLLYSLMFFSAMIYMNIQQGMNIYE